MIIEVDTKLAYVVTRLAGDPQYIEQGLASYYVRNREAYFKSKWWESVQANAMRRYDYKCANCGCKHSDDNPLETHDRVYRLPFTEQSWDIIILCQHCHSLFHQGHEDYDPVTDCHPYLDGLPNFADPFYLAKRKRLKEQRKQQREAERLQHEQEQALQEDYDDAVPF